MDEIFEEKNAKIQELEEEVTILRGRVEDGEDEIGVKEQKISDLEARVKLLIDEKQANKDEEMNLKGTIEMLRIQINTLVR